MKKFLKGKLFAFLLGLLLLPIAGILVACGEDKPTPQTRTFSHATVQLANNTHYTIVDGSTIEIPKDLNLREFLTAQNFVVTAHYNNNGKQEDEIVTGGYTFSVRDDTGAWKYVIDVYYNGDTTNPIGTFYAKIAVETLPNFTNVSTDFNEFARELRYTGNEYDIRDLVTTTNANETLKTLLNEGKVVVDESVPQSTFTATNPNVYYGNGNYDYYTAAIKAAEGYKWVINNEDVSSMNILWTIKRQIIDTPTLTSGTTFEYKHEWDDNQGKFVGVEQGLTFNYGNAENYIIPADKHSEASNYYSTSIRIADEYETLYTFMINDEETTNTAEYSWSITPMSIATPTLVGGTIDTYGSYHYTYTGNTIQPQVNVELPNLFDITYINQNSEDYRNWPYQIAVSLKNIYQSGNYNFNNGSDVILNYLIDKAPFPQDILEALAGINFTLEKEFYEGLTYENAVNSLSAYDFTNSQEDIAKTGYSQNSSFEFTLPDGANPNTIMNVDPSGYDVKVSYTIDNNHEPINFTAKLYITPIGLEVTTSWYLWDIHPGHSAIISDDENLRYHLYDFDNPGEGYDNYTHYRCYLSNYNDDITVTYTTKYGRTSDNLNETANNRDMVNAGYYDITANLAPNFANPSNYYIYTTDALGNRTTVTSLNYGKVIHIQKEEYYDYPQAGNSLENYYTGEERQVAINLSNYDKIDETSVIATTQYRANKNANWMEAQNTTEIGYYKTTFTYALADEWTQNYELVNGATAFEWVIYPNNYTLQTTDKVADGFVGWTTEDFDLDYGCNIEKELNEKFIVPDGINHYFNYSDTPIWDNDNNKWTYGSGYSNASPYSEDKGEYAVAGELYVNMDIPGYDQIIITIDGNTVIENGKRVYSQDNKQDLNSEWPNNNTSYGMTSWAHFEIKEPTPTTYTLETKITLGSNNYSFYSFTTGNETDYMLLTNAYSTSFSYRLATASDYTNLNKATLNVSTNYCLLLGLSPNTQYILMVGPDYTENLNHYFTIMVYPDQLTFEYNTEIPKLPTYDETTSVDGFIVSGKENVGPIVTVPSSVYTTGQYSGEINIHAIAANAFKNNTTLTTIYLPGQIYNIGDNAFSGCINLKDIYFDYNNGDWENIIFGKNVFADCGIIIVHTGNGVYYLNNETGLLSIKEGSFYSYEDAMWTLSQKFNIQLPYNNQTLTSSTYSYTQNGSVEEFLITLDNINETKYNQFIEAFTNTLGEGTDYTSETEDGMDWIDGDYSYSVVWDKTSTMTITISNFNI